ncbi:pimeloyl-[acyl-carrier protein] methyl ester esterase [Salinivibrio proteolyticus]|uniref:Pimeloyl-[acyl-carrier protein] methyl ester esterase n=1 Tax=Salinivibrio costicola TaxID=51367 RepID=A0ABX6K1A9_SALCS|nr:MULTISPECIES: pimeloyl-ACP methyl ester esterase BioH [Salinivibrio]OOF11838.1 pimeloyl-[acyl-carrier protein] methyl ester esterase [Salinivibrio sp. PR5]OOF23406.1 pimeloyl-[acyl-carrier protein] methyl ester esterase [Salinivibrio sp. IB574]OOF27144.1 pimeloyl-[acyl-carrier protein] methyl ester esterase [Salinivibrio proteolyticus]OOF30949.1 pimeloyl-[acyl-carrier protein] methyl ester esterase [Salinivibrio proteolyticus]PCE68543.1 pimeloyl-[acyl-carrier protein] methyl ester esterase 
MALCDWQSYGQGPDLVLIHGWGMNSAVWSLILPYLTANYRVHCVDLPGFGLSPAQPGLDLEQLAQVLLKESPAQATWLGWSLGGLVATQAALLAPHRLTGLVTVASSPKFVAEPGWRGIKPAVLNAFASQLEQDFSLTVERFMALQAMGSPTAKKDIKALKQAVFSRPAPDPQALADGLQILASADLRQACQSIRLPWLRLYGRLDGLVPVAVAGQMDAWVPHSPSEVFAHSAHAPFVTEPDGVVDRLTAFLATNCRPDCAR